MTDQYDAAVLAWCGAVPKQKFFKGPYDLFAVHDSGDDGERYHYVPVGNGNPPQFYPLFQCLIPDPRPGDLLDVSFEGQVTSDRNTNTEILTKMNWCAGSGDNVGLAEIGEENGENVSLAMHHIKIAKAAVFPVPPGTPTGALRFVTLNLSANCTDLVTPPLHINVDRDYSRLVVRHYRPRST